MPVRKTRVLWERENVGSPDTEREGFACRGATIVALHGEIDIASAHSAYHAVTDGAVDDCAVVDLSDVQFIDASGVGALMRLLRDATLARRHLYLAAPTPPVTRVFDALDLAEIFEIHPSVDMAAANHPVRHVSSGTGPQRRWHN